MSTLQRAKPKGGMALINIAAKCTTLLLSRMYMQGKNTITPTASWLRKWKLTGRQENPPYTLRIPAELEYLQIYAK
jgi:hypothetical protein